MIWAFTVIYFKPLFCECFDPQLDVLNRRCFFSVLVYEAICLISRGKNTTLKLVGSRHPSHMRALISIVALEIGHKLLNKRVLYSADDKKNYKGTKLEFICQSCSIQSPWTQHKISFQPIPCFLLPRSPLENTLTETSLIGMNHLIKIGRASCRERV